MSEPPVDPTAAPRSPWAPPEPGAADDARPTAEQGTGPEPGSGSGSGSADAPWVAPGAASPADAPEDAPPTPPTGQQQPGTHWDTPGDRAWDAGTAPHPGAPAGYGSPGPYGHAQQPGPGPAPGWGGPSGTAQFTQPGQPGQPGPGGPGTWAPPGGGPPGGGPPGWGQPGPGWGGPYPPPPRRPFPWKVVGIVAGAVLLVALIVLGLLAFVVGPRFARVDVLDADAVAQGVTRVVTDEWHRQISDVSCPADQEVRTGARFTCSATVDGRPVQVPVSVVDPQGTYSVGQPR
ncbi:DUF4333 domain-containing protein [Actinomycetospora aeridis]|uniref:DUF4333 domain-containing protein n=1 Tax=Actinomycetospora aeridis TaxID=3129231 RepID=A0ABU8N6L3_9PSEU